MVLLQTIIVVTYCLAASPAIRPKAFLKKLILQFSLIKLQQPYKHCIFISDNTLEFYRFQTRFNNTRYQHIFTYICKTTFRSCLPSQLAYQNYIGGVTPTISYCEFEVYIFVHRRRNLVLN